jgi:hypothetical protein
MLGAVSGGFPSRLAVVLPELSSMNQSVLTLEICRQLGL